MQKKLNLDYKENENLTLNDKKKNKNVTKSVINAQNQSIKEDL